MKDVAVTQEDREAAMAPEVSRGYTQRTRDKVLRGDKDTDELVQAFARHNVQEDEATVAKVGMALCETALGGKQCPCAERGVFRCTDAYPGYQAIAAIRALRGEP